MSVCLCLDLNYGNSENLRARDAQGLALFWLRLFIAKKPQPGPHEAQPHAGKI